MSKFEFADVFAIVRAMLGIFLFMFFVLTVTYGLGVVIQGGFLSISFVAAMAMTALMASLAHGLTTGVPAVRTVGRVKEWFALETVGPRGRGFRAEVPLGHDMAALVRLIDMLLDPYDVDRREVSSDSACWRFSLIGYRFRLIAQCLAPNALRFQVEPVSRWVRSILLPAENDGAMIIAGVLWKANELGILSAGPPSTQTPEWLGRTVAKFCNPSVISRRRGRRFSRT